MRGFPLPFWVRPMPGLLIALAVVGSGCGVYQAGVRTGPAHAQALPPVDPAQVQLFGGDDPTLVGQEVGYVVGVSDLDEQGLALQRLRGAAAKLGADAIVDLRFEVLQSSSVVARGRAVRRAPVAPMPVAPTAAPAGPARAPAPAPAEEVMP